VLFPLVKRCNMQAATSIWLPSELCVFLTTVKTHCRERGFALGYSLKCSDGRFHFISQAELALGVQWHPALWLSTDEQLGHASTSKNDDLCCNPKIRLTGTAHYQSAPSLTWPLHNCLMSDISVSAVLRCGALRYKPEGRGFESRWCHWNFSLT
jgi:hypothetical protein